MRYFITFRDIDDPFVPLIYVPLQQTIVNAENEEDAKKEFYEYFKDYRLRIETIELLKY